MDGGKSAGDAFADHLKWSVTQFGTADLGDARRNARLVQVGEKMMSKPNASIPQQMGSWTDLNATYRLLSNPSVDAEAIQEPHRHLTLQYASTHDVILAVEDTTELDYTHLSKAKGLGKIGDGKGRGFLQHATLALTENDELLGILDAQWYKRTEVPKGETRRERQARWTEADTWADSVRRIGAIPEGTRLIHVCDRGADVYGFMNTALNHGHGFLLRAVQNRQLADTDLKLWDYMRVCSVTGSSKIKIKTQKDKKGNIKRDGRVANLDIRYTEVSVPPPQNDPRTEGQPPLKVWAVHVLESDPPEESDPLECIWLTSEPVQTLKHAELTIERYQKRWLIEEWHRVLKEGCRAEAAQLDDIDDLKRLLAILGVVAIRLLQLRNIAGLGHGELPDKTSKSPSALQAVMPWIYIVIVAKLSKSTPQRMTPHKFWCTVAKRGGWVGRKSDGRPGWKTIWAGWYDIQVLVDGALLLIDEPIPPKPKNCV